MLFIILRHKVGCLMYWIFTGSLWREKLLRYGPGDHQMLDQAQPAIFPVPTRIFLIIALKHRLSKKTKIVLSKVGWYELIVNRRTKKPLAETKTSPSSINTTNLINIRKKIFTFSSLVFRARTKTVSNGASKLILSPVVSGTEGNGALLHRF